MAGPRSGPQPGPPLTGVTDLPALLAALTGDAQARAERLLDVRTGVALTDPPAEIEPWLVEVFGSVEAVRRQRVARVSNLATGEATLFAPLRARRPTDAPRDHPDLAAAIDATRGDPFCEPGTATPANAFGRVRGRHVLTGANAAAADINHAVLVFDRHDPLAFDADLVADLFDTGREWAERAHRADRDAVNYLLIWNCGWRAGGSIVHGHAQALLGAGAHYARPERFRHDSAAYRSAYGACLSSDLAALHNDLGLAIGGAVKVAAHLTPVKEREVIVIGQPGMDERDGEFTAAVARALVALRDRLGVRAFNLALWRPPLGSPDGWEDVPPIVRVVDRGDPFARSSDIGAMELYGTPIVGTDPYEVIAGLA